MFSSHGTRFGSPNSYPILVCAHGAESKNLCCKADIINQKPTGWHHWNIVDVEIEVTAEFFNLWTPFPKVELLSMMKSSRSYMRRNSEETLLAETVLYGIAQCENLAFSPEHVFWLPSHAVTTKDPVLKLDPKKDSISELIYARTVQNWLKTFQDNLAITLELEGQGCCWWEGSLVQMCWKNLGKVIVQPWPSMRPGAEPAHPWWASVGDALQTQGDVINLSTCV